MSDVYYLFALNKGMSFCTRPMWFTVTLSSSIVDLISASVLLSSSPFSPMRCIPLSPPSILSSFLLFHLPSYLSPLAHSPLMHTRFEVAPQVSGSTHCNARYLVPGMCIHRLLLLSSSAVLPRMWSKIVTGCKKSCDLFLLAHSWVSCFLHSLLIKVVS